MITHKIGWAIWSLIPVAALAYHFGPGQRAFTEDRARDVLIEAQKLDSAAQSAQDSAFEKHLAALAARKAAVANASPELTRAAQEAAEVESRAYRAAAEAWKATADKLQSAQELLNACGSPRADEVRIAKARALIRAGEISSGVNELTALLDALDDAGQAASPRAREAREELATGYYYGARLMRLAGRPTAEWREISELSRQNFRYLAETCGADAPEKPADLQRNLELVLNLEQSAQEELMASPLPKNSPRGGGDKLGPPKKGKSKRPPRNKQDARGAGGVGDIEGGW